MNVSSVKTMNYEQITMNNANKNKPNSNPIKPNFHKAQMNVNSLITKDYIKYDDFAVRKNKPNSNPISVKPKMSASVFVTKDYDNVTAFRPQKNKPNQTQSVFLPSCSGWLSSRRSLESKPHPVEQQILAVQVSDFVIEYKIGTDCIVTGCPQNKKMREKKFCYLTLISS